MRVVQQSSVASVNGVGEGREESVRVVQQSSVASVNGVGEGGRKVCVWVSRCYVWCQESLGMGWVWVELVKGGREVCMYT